MSSLEFLFGDEANVLHETDFQLLMLSTLFPILVTGIVSPILDSVIVPLGTTPANIGLIISFASAPAIVLIPIAGILSDRYGRKPVIVVSLLIFGVAGVAIATTTDFQVVLGLRLLQGVGFAGLVPTITTSIGDMYIGVREETGQGLRIATNGVSGFVFPLIAGGVVLIAWNLPFILYGLAIPVAVIVYIWFSEPAREESNTPSPETDEQTYWAALFHLLSQRTVLAIVVARWLPVIVWITFLTYNSLIVSRLLDGTPLQAGILAATGNFIFAIGGSQAGRISSRFRSAFYPLLIGNLLLSFGLIVFLFAPGLIVGIGGITLTGAGFGITLTLYRSYISRISPPDLRGGMISLSATGARVSATATPIIIGWMISTWQPTVGIESAIRIAGVGAALVGGGGGVLCILVANIK